MTVALFHADQSEERSTKDVLHGSAGNNATVIDRRYRKSLEAEVATGSLRISLKYEQESYRKRFNKRGAAQSTHSGRRLRDSWTHHRQMPRACGWQYWRISFRLSAG